MSEPIEEGQLQPASAGWTNKPQPQLIPKPSVWPVALSLGVTLLCFGLVTHWIITTVGVLLTLVSAHGWFKELVDEQLL